MRKGITAVSAAILVIVILILAGTVSITSYNSIQNSKKTIFAIEIAGIQEEVTKYHMDDPEGLYPTDNTEYVLSLSSISTSSLEQFMGEAIDASNNVTLYEIDLSAIGIEDNSYGTKKTSKDVYVLSKETGKVFYLDGVKAGNKTYYTLTNDLIVIRGRRATTSNSVTYDALGITTDGFSIKNMADNKKEVYLSNVKVNGNEIKMAKYEIGVIPSNLAQEYFKDNGSSIIGNRIKVTDRTFITFYVENKNGDYIVRYVNYGGNIMGQDPNTLHSIYRDSKNNTAPIPSGFVVSKATGETEIDDGLVIYEGTDEVTDSNVSTAMTTRNQYVWVPVPNISDFVRRDGYSNGSLQTVVSGGNATEPFSKGTLSASNDLTGEYAEYTKMYNSVAKYGGFYIARYEAGSLTERTNTANRTTTVVIQKDKYPYNYVGWGPSMTAASGDVTNSSKNQGKGAVELSRSVYPDSSSNTTGVVSTLIYGVEWDAAIKFLSDVKNTTVTPNVLYIQNSVNMGWHSNNKSNNASYKTGIDVGANTANRVKNIYDMAGNLREATMEAYDTSNRINRGGSIYYSGSSDPISIRYTGVTASQTNVSAGFRPALYMK